MIILEYIRVFIWPTVVISICLIFKSQLSSLFCRLYHAEFPGGVSIDLAQDIEDVKRLSTKVQSNPPKHEYRDRPAIPLTEANSRMLKLGLHPSPSGLDMKYYLNLANQDPNIALAGLRIEFDILAKNLAKGFKIPISEKESGIRLFRKLYDNGAIDTEQMQLIIKLFNVCTAAVHGNVISFSESIAVIESAEVLADDYLAWLSWGFEDRR